MPGYQPRHDTDPVWFNGTQVNNLTVTSDQTGVLITAVHGWDDRPDVRDVRSNRSGQDGEYADNLYLGGRTITIEGEVYGSTWANLQSRKRTLAALFIPTSTEVLLKIPDPATASPTAVYASTGMTGYERSSVRVVEAIRFGETRDPRCQVFQVVVRASDPRIYSDVEVSTDSGTSGTATRTVTVDQSGTYPTPTDLTITGPLGSDWAIGESSSGLRLASSTRSLASGESLQVSTDDRTIIWNAAYYRSRISRSDIIAGWMLNETSGTTADNIQTTSAYDLTYNGGFTLNQAGPATSVASVLLNGSTGYLSRSFQAGLNTSAFTVEGWVKITTTASTAHVVSSMPAAATTGHYLTFDGAAASVVVGTGSTLVALPAYLPDMTNTWAHLAYTVKSGEQRLYVNGSLVASGSATFSPNTTEQLTLGRRSWGAASYLTGNLGPWFMYSSIFTPAEIADAYAASAATTATSAYQYLNASSSRWADLGTSSSTFSLTSTGLGSGSKLNVAYRDARV